MRGPLWAPWGGGRGGHISPPAPPPPPLLPGPRVALAFSRRSKEARMIGAQLAIYRNILVDSADHVACVTMNRPEKRNALSVEHMSELIDCFGRIGSDRGVSAVILKGNGPAFCAGHDLGEMIGQS